MYQISCSKIFEYSQSSYIRIIEIKSLKLMVLMKMIYLQQQVGGISDEKFFKTS